MHSRLLQTSLDVGLAPLLLCLPSSAVRLPLRMTHSAQSTSPSVSMYGGASRDFLWERALAQLPVALGDALRVSELDDPGVLLLAWICGAPLYGTWR